jgi:hypothetical protein
MTKKVRIGIVISAIWLLVLTIYRIAEVPPGLRGIDFDLYDLQQILSLGVLPLAIVWSIWWIRKV